MKDLINLIKELEGHVLAIGFNDNKLITALEKNNKITNYDLMNEITKDKCMYYERSKTKNINIKKINKVFKKKKIDYIICNYDEIKKYLRTFIRNSVYINKNNIYIYGKIDKYEIDILKKRYMRYNSRLSITENKNNCILTIDSSNSKNHSFKSIFYDLIDIVSYGTDIIASILTS